MGLNRFVDTIYEGLKSFGNGQSENVSMQEFCSACSSNEPLQFSTLVRLFDKDRKRFIMEKLFIDEEIADLQNKDVETMNFKDDADLDVNYSRVERAVKETQALLTSLAQTEEKVRKAARDLEISEDALGLRPQEGDPNAAPTVEPKSNQDADECSLLGEEEIGTQPLLGGGEET